MESHAVTPQLSGQRPKLARLLWCALNLGAAAVFSHACSVEAVLPTGTLPPPAPPAGPPSPPASPAPAAPSPLASAPLARRVALDLGLRLPSTADTAYLTSASSNFTNLVTSYLGDRNLGQALGGLHDRMWHLDSAYLPDLDTFVAAGNTTLGTALTTATRQLIVQEPGLYLRYIIEQQLPLAAAFTLGQGIVHSSLLGVWNVNDTGTAFVGEPYHLVTYNDGRPSGGVLTSNGMLASFASREDPKLRQRTYRMMVETLCLEAEETSAHQFASLNATELQQDLVTVALGRSDCAGCHLQFESPAAAFSGLGYGSTLSTWLAYQAPSSSSGTYSGNSFATTSALMSLISKDPRLHQCEVKKLLQGLYQRQFSTNDHATFGAAMDAFYAGSQSLRAAAAQILASSEYAYAIAGSNTSGSYLRGSTGLRFLGRQQWQAVIAALIPSASITFTDQLDPGHDETLTSDDAVPNGAYWHEVDRVARAAAAAIVAAELADDVPASNRRLLTSLPDGSGSGASTAVITKQLTDLWLRLTGVSLAASDPLLATFLTLWTSTAPGSSAAESRRAWTVELTGILSHPLFVSY